MKKLLLTLTLAITTIFASAQCTPDSQFTLPGIYPDSATGLPSAMVGQAYNEVITIVAPLDTTGSVGPITVPVSVLTIKLDSVTGLPASFSYDCATANCTFAGGSTSCAVLTSPSPTVAEIGSHQIFMYTSTIATHSTLGITLPTQLDTIDYYYIKI